MITEIQKVINLGVIDTLSIYNPIKGQWLLCWDLHEDEEGFKHYQKIFERKPSIEEVKKLITDHYNQKCNEEILGGLEFEGSKVWLSQENQFNYKAAFDFAVQTEGANLPVKIKLGTDDEPVYKVFEEVSELQGFITAVITHINSTLNKYWEIKDQIDWSKYTVD